MLKRNKIIGWLAIFMNSFYSCEIYSWVVKLNFPHHKLGSREVNLFQFVHL